MQWGPCAVVFAVACGVYLNTLRAGFTFDDNFAVVNPCLLVKSSTLVTSSTSKSPVECSVHLQLSNGDVMHDNKSLLDLFHHDFW